MIRYVELEVRLHGLEETTVERVRAAVVDQLRELYPRRRFDSDVEVDVIEWAGTEEPEKTL